MARDYSQAGTKQCAGAGCSGRRPAVGEKWPQRKLLWNMSDLNPARIGLPSKTDRACADCSTSKHSKLDRVIRA